MQGVVRAVGKPVSHDEIAQRARLILSVSVFGTTVKSLRVWEDIKGLPEDRS